MQKEEKNALYLSYASLVHYVPFLGAEEFQFPWRQIFDGFLAEDVQKPKQLLAHPTKHIDVDA